MKIVRWTQEEIDILKHNYKFGNIHNIEKLLPNRTYKAIAFKAKKLGLRTREYWNDEEIAILTTNYERCSLDEMELLLPNRNRHGIIAKAISLNLTNKSILESRFNNEDKEFVFKNYNNMTDKEISEVLGRSISAINNYRFRNGLIKIHEKSSYNDLSEYVRRNNLDWKKNSMLNCNYKCVLTGKRFDDIHHLYGLNLILNETMEELNISVKNTIDNYSKKELRLILDKFREKQSTYPLGVCLVKEIHELFHSLYGYGNNTIEQWNEFKLDYKSGKYGNVD